MVTVTVLTSNNLVPKKVFDSNSNSETPRKAAGTEVLDPGRNDGNFQK